MNQNWILIIDAAGTLLGVTSLIFSILAWRRASGAEQAAEKARQAILRSNAAEDLQFLLSRAKQFLESLQRGQTDLALFCATELVANINLTKQRWPDVSKDSLERAHKALGYVCAALERSGAHLKPKAKENVLYYAHEVLTVLAAESGKMLQAIEERRN